MGSNESNPRVLSAREDDLVFYIDLDDPYMGTASIYTSKKMPLCYILKMTREIKDSKIYNFFQRIENMQSPALVSLYGFQMNRHKCCDKIITQTVTSYWEYYNFYFNDYLKRRVEKGCPYLESQIWHIVHMCCQGATILRKNNCYYDFKTSTMVITPQGKLKLCWAHLMSQNRHMRYFRFFQKQQLQDFFYSPQQLDLIANRQFTTKLNLQKCSSFSVGILLLQCLTMRDPLTTFYYANRKVSFKNIKHYIDTQIKNNYSANIVQLLRMLLAKDPKERQSLHFIYEHFKLMMSDDHELRVCGGKKQEKQKKEHQNNFQTKSHHLVSDFSDTKTVKYNHFHKK